MFALKQTSLLLGKRDPHHVIVSGSYIPTDPEEAKYGSVFFVFTLKDVRELASEIKSIILEGFRQHFYQDLERNPEQSFEETLQAINDNGSKLADAEGIDWSESLNVAMVVFSGNDLHLSVGGQSSIYLLRGKHLTNISEGLNPESDHQAQKIFFSLASGNLLASDKIVLSTENLGEIVDLNALKAKLGSDHITEGESIPALSHATLAIVSCQIATSGGRAKTADITESKTEKYIPTKMSVGKSKLANTWDILKGNVQKNIERIFDRNRPFVRKPFTLSKLLMFAGIGLIVVVGIYMLISYQRDSGNRQNIETLVAQASRDREDAKTRAIYDKESAKNLLLADQKKLSDALPGAKDVVLVAQINGELVEIRTLLETIDNVFRIEDPKVAFDLSKERSNFDGKGMLRVGNDMYAFDSDALYKLVVDKIDRRTVVVNGNTTSSIALATPITKDNIIELYTTDKQLIEYKGGNFTPITAPGENANWQNAVDVAEYVDRRFMYFLDPGNNTIWRYGRDQNTFQAAVAKNVAKLDFSKAVSLAIDGAVYVLTSDGNITKTYADEKKDFEIDGLTDPLSEPTKILADKNQDTGRLYILDPKNSRVVVLSKSGKYEAQYIFPGYNDHLDIELVPSLTKDQLMVMTRSGKVLQVELK